jgi:hypothetical protein
VRGCEPKWSGDFECGNFGQVYEIYVQRYEIHIIPDPNPIHNAQWFFFKVDTLIPGEYFFVIAGFSRPYNLHKKGSQICGYSESSARRGIGWQRIGSNEVVCEH